MQVLFMHQSVWPYVQVEHGPSENREGLHGINSFTHINKKSF